MTQTTQSTTGSPGLREILPQQLVPALVQVLPLEFLKQQGLIPIRTAQGRIAVAMADPMNLEAYDALVNLLADLPADDEAGWRLEHPCPRLACPRALIEQAISHCYYQNAQTELTHQAAGDEPETTESASDGPEDLLSITHKAPAIQWVNHIFFQAVQGRASDIHIEPYDDTARVRFRVDGVLHDVLVIPSAQVDAVSARLKIMSKLDIAERRLPQDGQSQVRIGDKLVDVRVSVVPTTGGERIVLRLLDKGRDQLSLQELGMTADTLSVFRRLIRLPHGIVLLTGPTGCGKTTTLYAALNELNSEELNILTVEDPVEYQLPGIGQMQVKPKIDLTFAHCLRHILRQDPDVVMIGEIRDRETAQIAIEASMTGHLVFSTLHTNDAASAVCRLVHMGVEPYLIASSLVAVVAQRLVRTICPHCRRPDPSPPGESVCRRWNLPPDTAFQRGLGCPRCLDTGYRGRRGIFEMLVIDDALRALITEGRDSRVLRRHGLDHGMVSLRQAGLRQACEGVTTVDEVLRVTQEVVAGQEEPL